MSDNLRLTTCRPNDYVAHQETAGGFARRCRGERNRPDSPGVVVRGWIAAQANMMGLGAAEAARRFDGAADKRALLDELIVEAGRLAGEPDLLADDPPPIGDIVRHVLRWLAPAHPYSTFLDYPFGDKAVQFLADCADQIAQRGDGARFTERQRDWARSLWRQASHEILDTIARARREARA